jgi:ankyrin repeat protein
MFIGCSLDQVEVVELLLTLGADIHKLDRFSGSPLDDALREGHEKVIKALLTAPAKFDQTKLAFSEHSGDIQLTSSEHPVNIQ